MKEDIRIQGQLRAYLQWPLFMAVILMAANVVVGLMDLKAGMTGFTLFYAAVCGWLYLYKRKRLLGGLLEFSAQYAELQEHIAADMAFPYAIADESGLLLWMNDGFADIVRDDRKNKTLFGLFPELTREILNGIDGEGSLHITYGDSFYRMELRHICAGENGELNLDAPDGDEDETLWAVYLFDETELLALKQEIADQNLVAGLIYLDNYDEALESVEEVRRSLLVALIDRKVSKYISGVNGIVKKMEKDKYFFAIEQKYMPSLEAERFSLLEDVKTVNIGNEMAVTLSIGIGINGDTYIRNYEYARTAIDMALGRGGDQAVVKNGEKIQYYGGKSQQLEKTTRVKARVKAHALRELLETKDRLLIMGHKIGDIDSFGSAIGVYRIAAALGKKAHIVINEVTSSVRPMMDRFINNSDYPQDLFLMGDDAAELADPSTALVVVDVNRPSYTEEPRLLNLVKTIVVIDHHRQSSEIISNATLSYVEPYASSACELVAEILQYVTDSIRIKSLEADAMYAGIVIDTNNFTRQESGPSRPRRS